MYHILLEVDILFGFLSSFGSQKLLQFWLGQRTARLFLHKVKVDFPYRNKILIWVWGSAERTLYRAQDLQYCVTTLVSQLAYLRICRPLDRPTNRPNKRCCFLFFVEQNSISPLTNLLLVLQTTLPKQTLQLIEVYQNVHTKYGIEAALDKSQNWTKLLYY